MHRKPWKKPFLEVERVGEGLAVSKVDRTPRPLPPLHPIPATTASKQPQHDPPLTHGSTPSARYISSTAILMQYVLFTHCTIPHSSARGMTEKVRR